MKAHISGIIRIILFLLLPLQVIAQQFNFKNYSVGDGLAQSQVFDMIEDSRGYIWMATRGGGLSRFDGNRFQTYTEQDGLVNNYVLCLYEDREKQLWIGTNNGISKYNGLSFETLLHGEDEAPRVIGCIKQDHLGRIWLGTNAGLLVGSNTGEFTNYSREIGFYEGNISSVFEDSQGRLWVGCDLGVSCLSFDSSGALKNIKTYNRKEGLSNELVRCIAEDLKGNIWVGTYGGGINVLTTDAVFQPSIQGDFTSSIILDLMTDSAGYMWAATPGSGVIQWNLNDSSSQSLREADGLANDHVRTIIKDSWDNIWIGTSGGGISQYSGQQFIHYNKQKGLPGNYVYSVFEDQDGLLWMGTSGGGVTSFDGQKMVTYGADSGFLNVKVKVIFQDCNDNLWLGTEGSGLARYDGEKFRIFNGYTGLSGNWIRDIEQDSWDHLWVATAGGGITKISGPDTLTGTYEYTIFTISKGLLKNRINCVHVDQQDRVWYGCVNGGVGYIEADSTQTLPSSVTLSSLNVRSLVEDKYGYLWAGTAGGGVNRIGLYGDTFSLEVISTKDGLTSDNIYQLAFDDDQHLWVGTESGVDLVRMDNKRNIIEVKHFGKDEGFLGIETCKNAAFKSRDGNLWFGTVNGLTRCNPGRNVLNPYPPKVRISAINLFYEPLEKTVFGGWVSDWNTLKEGLQLPYDQNHLSFDFIGINHKNPSQVQYRWKMENIEADWSPASYKTDATYSNIPPGKYKFLVMASNEDGVWSDPVEASFTIQSPIWELWWFRTIVGLVILLIIVLIFNARVRQVKRKTQIERNRLELERDLLKLEQKALRLQMNPHFIFHALNSIQSQIGKGDEKKARYFLAKFSKLMRQTLENSRETFIPLESEIKTLDNYLSLEKNSREDQFDYIISVDDGLEDDILLPPMIIQPFLENAIIHGVASLKDRKGLIELRFYREGNQLICEIKDNGIGRAAAAKLTSQQEHHNKSTALVVTQERLDLLQKGAVKSLEILDLKDDEGDASGTLVILRIPLSI